MHLILFDIDGTLISTGGAGGEAFFAALREEFKISQLDRDIPFAGRTDRAIAQDLLTRHGLPDDERHWTRLRDAYLVRLPEHLRRRQGQILPGVSELLAHLRQRTDMALGLLTGNLAHGARMKLEHFGLNGHFAFGGFGDVHPGRDCVAADAVTAAQQSLGRTVEPTRTWVLGDTPHDVACARAIGARAVAVATGIHTREQLEPTGADYVVDTLCDRRWLADLEGEFAC